MMTAKEHYDTHLGNFYSWYAGDFEMNMESFKAFCVDNGIKPNDSKYAIDLGADNGIQAIALANLGFKVKAIDFNNRSANTRYKALRYKWLFELSAPEYPAA